MANSRHLKRHAMPKSWNIDRKLIKFVTKPRPGSFKRDYVVSILSLIRDELNLVKTLKEAKYVLKNDEVLLNGKKVENIKTAVGIFDILEIKSIGLKKIFLFNELGKISTIDVKDNNMYLKVSNKKLLRKGEFQINFMNSFNLKVDEKQFKNIKVGDTIVYDFKNKKIVEHIPFKENIFAYIFDGTFKGHFVKLGKVTGYNGLGEDLIELEFDKKIHSTAKKYCFPISLKEETLKRFR
jgi:ribosomal protein S4E